MRADTFAWYGYAELVFHSRWVKVGPTFDIATCRRRELYRSRRIGGPHDGRVVLAALGFVLAGLVVRVFARSCVAIRSRHQERRISGRYYGRPHR